MESIIGGAELNDGIMANKHREGTIALTRDYGYQLSRIQPFDEVEAFVFSLGG